MGWIEVMEELESKLEGTFTGKYRPLDDVPFFRVQYPPNEEREALRQFRLLAQRLQQRGWKIESISLTEASRLALMSLLNCSASELAERLSVLEAGRDRRELQEQLSEHLPAEVTKILREKLRSLGRQSAAILFRLSALFPFVRSSAVLEGLQGHVDCAIVMPYPGTTLGALLDAAPASSRWGHYRGEVITWR